VNLTPYIKELIINHDCIILPDFGGFETSYTPARFDPKTKKMLPPTKVVEFKPTYKTGGEILMNHISTKLNIDLYTAKKIIDDYISELKTRIRNKEQIFLEGIGIFKPGFSGEPIFEPFDYENYLVDSFGLDAFEINEEEILKQKESSRLQIPEIAFRNNTLSFVIIGIIVISILMAITVILSAKFDLYLFNFGDKNQQTDYLIIGGETKNDLNTKLEKQIDEYTSIKSALKYSETKNDTNKQSHKNYLLVVGSFKSLSNANDLYNKLIVEGYPAEIIEDGNNFRVCIGSFEQKKTANEELQRIRRQINRSVWLLNANN
jgi:nucleoid DNA-binding protein